MVIPPSESVLLDTHSLIWLDSRNPKLGPQSRCLADDALGRSVLFVSSAVFWEAALLTEKGRITLRIADPAEWRRELIARGLREIKIDIQTAMASVGYKKWSKDLFDCLFAATAIAEKMRLVTADAELLKIKLRGLSLADATK